MISPGQTRMIHTAIRALGMSNDDYRDMLEERFKVRSSSDLTSTQARLFIDELMVKGFASAGAHLHSGSPKPELRNEATLRKKGKNVIALPSKAQLGYIRDLRTRIGWKAEDGFNRWLKVMFSLDKIRTSKDAQRVIEGLKGLIKNGHSIDGKENIEAAG